eukprot:Nk52_evm6s710 gene=Nk52_evmTU6s710
MGCIVSKGEGADSINAIQPQKSESPMSRQFTKEFLKLVEADTTFYVASRVFTSSVPISGMAITAVFKTQPFDEEFERSLINSFPECEQLVILSMLDPAESGKQAGGSGKGGEYFEASVYASCGELSLSLEGLFGASFMIWNMNLVKGRTIRFNTFVGDVTMKLLSREVLETEFENLNEGPRHSSFGFTKDAKLPLKEFEKSLLGDSSKDSDGNERNKITVKKKETVAPTQMVLFVTLPLLLVEPVPEEQINVAYLPNFGEGVEVTAIHVVRTTRHAYIKEEEEEEKEANSGEENKKGKEDHQTATGSGSSQLPRVYIFVLKDDYQLKNLDSSKLDLIDFAYDMLIFTAPSVSFLGRDFVYRTFLVEHPHKEFSCQNVAMESLGFYWGNYLGVVQMVAASVPSNAETTIKVNLQEDSISVFGTVSLDNEGEVFLDPS